MIRPIAISLSPNLEGKDVLLSLKLLLSPRSFYNGDCVRRLETYFRRFFSVSYAVSFTSGRGALYAILKALGIGRDDEVLLQPFTCVAVPNSVIATGAMPIYVDISSFLTFDISDLEKKITKRTKAIIVQHTFGIPSPMEQISALAKKYNLFVIEDCAHVIGGTYKGKKLGTFGDAAFFSFGRDKAFSSVFGGMAITDNKKLGNEIRHFQRLQEYPKFGFVAQQLFHPIAFYFFVLPLYNLFFLGKLVLVFFQKLKFLSFPVLPEEKKGKTLPVFSKKLPNALACMMLSQIERIKEFNQHREEIVEYYISQLSSQYDLPFAKKTPLLRFPMLLDKRDELISKLKRKGIYIGKWYSEIIDPKGVNLDNIHYKVGFCPNAERIAKQIVNLPTYPVMKKNDAQTIVSFLKNDV